MGAAVLKYDFLQSLIASPFFAWNNAITWKPLASQDISLVGMKWVGARCALF